jgi:hypothetical protein
MQDEYYKKALNAVDELTISEEKKRILYSFAKQLMKREA